MRRARRKGASARVSLTPCDGGDGGDGGDVPARCGVTYDGTPGADRGLARRLKVRGYLFASALQLRSG